MMVFLRDVPGGRECGGIGIAIDEGLLILGSFCLAC